MVQCSTLWYLGITFVVHCGTYVVHCSTLWYIVVHNVVQCTFLPAYSNFQPIFDCGSNYKNYYF